MGMTENTTVHKNKEGSMNKVLYILLAVAFACVLLTGCNISGCDEPLTAEDCEQFSETEQSENYHCIWLLEDKEEQKLQEMEEARSRERAVPAWDEDESDYVEDDVPPPPSTVRARIVNNWPPKIRRP
jgi:hypothetical protein